MVCSKLSRIFETLHGALGLRVFELGHFDGCNMISVAFYLNSFRVGLCWFVGEALESLIEVIWRGFWYNEPSVSLDIVGRLFQHIASAACKGPRVFDFDGRSSARLAMFRHRERVCSLLSSVRALAVFPRAFRGGPSVWSRSRHIRRARG